MFPLLAVLVVAYAHPEQLVEPEWVAQHAFDNDVRVIDMRQAGYADGHVPGAEYVAPGSIRDPRNPPTFLPTPESFAGTMRALGIDDSTRVIVYDERGGLYAARLWWLLNYFGHSNVALMNGGWTRWTAERRPVTTEVRSFASQPAPDRFAPRPSSRWVATAADVVASIDKPGVKIVDARTAAEIEGRDLRGIKRGGFVPSSIPVYWEDLIDPQTKTFKSADDIRKIYADRGILPSNEVIAYCQVGMRASVDLFALHLVGYDNLRNYYGAWEEWGNRDDLPIGTKKQ